MLPNKTHTFLPLVGIYEPSAIQQLPDGQFLVLEDEKEHAISLLTLDASGVVKHKSLTQGWFEGNDDFWGLDDLEGLTLDQAGNFYAVTSHSRNEGGDQKKSRDKLVRFQIKDGHVRKPLVVDGLKLALTGANPLLAAAAEIEDVKAAGGLNIEGLELSADQKTLLIGFRSPLQDGLAVIASVENLTGIFEKSETPQVSKKLQTLDLGGHGIRGISYIAALDGFLLISGPTSKARDEFRLWFWSGLPSAPARLVTVPGLQGLERAEGLSAALVDGVPHIVIVSDDGDRKAEKPGHFVLLDLTQLNIAPAV